MLCGTTHINVDTVIIAPVTVLIGRIAGYFSLSVCLDCRLLTQKHKNMEKLINGFRAYCFPGQ